MGKKLSRRKFMKTGTAVAAGIGIGGFATGRTVTAAVPAKETSGLSGSRAGSYRIRLGGPIYKKNLSPEEWTAHHKSLGFAAAKCPLKPGASSEEIKAFKKAAAKADIIVAEVGAWSNPIAEDETQRKEAMEKCISSLQLADEPIGIQALVRVSGAVAEKVRQPGG